MQWSELLEPVRVLLIERVTDVSLMTAAGSQLLDKPFDG
jgi:hypothetical protein